MRAALALLAACGGARPAPAPAPPPPPATGWMDDGVVERALLARKGALEGCYAKQLELRPGIGGKVVVSFRIGPAGGVQSATAAGFDRAVDACLEGILRTLDVPAPHGGPVDVTYPLLFGDP